MLNDAMQDSATMLRRNLRRTLRYPLAAVVTVGLPLVFLLLFVYVFGDTMGAGLAGGGREDYLDYVTPGILLLAVAGAAQGVAISVAMDMTEGIVARFTETLRGLLLGTPIGDSAILAVAWSVAIGAASYVWAKRLFNRGA